MLICNWKMYGNTRLAEEYNERLSKYEQLIVCPPFPFISLLKGDFFVGAQNSHEEKEGAYTGEVSPVMLKDVGCSHVLLGHSERRKYFEETNAIVQEKALRAHNSGLIPIVCVGSLEKDIDAIKSKILNQMRALPPSSVIAYEPIWSIGSDEVPTVTHIAEITEWIKSQGFVKVVYGGSVNEKNAQEILRACDGLLVGRLSLKVDAIEKVASLLK